MFYRVCLSVHVNALRTAGTQAPTAPRWPHHHEYCMMGTWGDEIISKGNPIIFSPTLHLFHISSLLSSISPPSKRESGMTHPFTPLPWCLLTAPRTGLCVPYRRTNESGSVFLLTLTQRLTKDPSISRSGSGHFLTETLSLLQSHLLDVSSSFAGRRGNAMPVYVSMCESCVTVRVVPNCGCRVSAWALSGGSTVCAPCSL